MADGYSIKYCKGHGWQVLAGANVTIETVKECGNCTATERYADEGTTK